MGLRTIVGDVGGFVRSVRDGLAGEAPPAPRASTADEKEVMGWLARHPVVGDMQDVAARAAEKDHTYADSRWHGMSKFEIPENAVAGSNRVGPGFGMKGAILVRPDRVDLASASFHYTRSRPFGSVQEMVDHFGSVDRLKEALDTGLTRSARQEAGVEPRPDPIYNRDPSGFDPVVSPMVGRFADRLERGPASAVMRSAAAESLPK